MNIEEIFEDMNYGSASESDKGVKDWIERHHRVFSAYICGKFKQNGENSDTADIFDVGSREKLATVKHCTNDLRDAVDAANTAHQEWKSITALKRTKFLNGLASSLLKNRNLFAKLESVSTGRLFQNVLNGCIPRAVGNLEYFAGWCYILAKEKQHLKPLGVIIINIPSNSSLSTAVEKFAPAIAAGNCIVLHLDNVGGSRSVNLGVYLLTQLFEELRIPAGVFNIVYSSEPLHSSLPHSGAVGGVSYSGNLEGGREISQLCTVPGATLNLFLDSKYTVIIFESADIDSAVEAVIQAIKLSYEQENWKTKLMVQESVQGKTLKLLKTYFDRLHSGHSLDTSVDVGPLAKPMLPEVVEYFKNINIDDATQFKLPHLDFLPFRTAKEAASLVNDSLLDVRASIWTENVTLAMEIVKTIDASTVWINCFGEQDPSIEAGNRKYSGQGRDGGEQCLYQYLAPSWHSVQPQVWKKFPEYNGVLISQIVDSIEKAVAMAHKSFPGWKALGASKRSKMLLSCLDALDKLPFATESQRDAVIEPFYSWASACDKCCGNVQEIPFKGQVLKIFEPLGVIAIVLRSDSSLMAFLFLVFSAISMGNAVVVFYEGTITSIFVSLIKEITAAGLPSGVINLVPHSSDGALSCIYRQHVQAVWLEQPTCSENSYIKEHLPNIWNICGDMNLSEVSLHHDVFRYHACQSKAIWLPQGVTFAN